MKGKPHKLNECRRVIGHVEKIDVEFCNKEKFISKLNASEKQQAKKLLDQRCAVLDNEINNTNSAITERENALKVQHTIIGIQDEYNPQRPFSEQNHDYFYSLYWKNNGN